MVVIHKTLNCFVNLNYWCRCRIKSVFNNGLMQFHTSSRERKAMPSLKKMGSSSNRDSWPDRFLFKGVMFYQPLQTANNGHPRRFTPAFHRKMMLDLKKIDIIRSCVDLGSSWKKRAFNVLSQSLLTFINKKSGVKSVCFMP